MFNFLKALKAVVSIKNLIVAKTVLTTIGTVLEFVIPIIKGFAAKVAEAQTREEAAAAAGV